MLQVCEAVAEAHSLGMVHRDLKPSNFFLTHRRDGTPLVKVLDFGIAKYKIELEQQDVSLTQTRALLGSPVYMSPEQVRSARSVDHRSDIWSLGVCLFELLTDTVPFGGETVTGVAAAVSTDPVPPIARHRPDVPAGLAAVIERCLAKRPDDRFQSIAELAAALVPFGPAEGNYSLYRISGTLRVSPPHGVDSLLRESANAAFARSTEHHTQVSTTHPVPTGPSAPAPIRKRIYVAGAAVAALGFVVFLVQGKQTSISASPATTSGVQLARGPTAAAEATKAEVPSAAKASAIPAPSAPTPEVNLAETTEPASSAATIPAMKNPKQKVFTQSVGLVYPKPTPSAGAKSAPVDKRKNTKPSIVGGSIDETVDTRH